MKIRDARKADAEILDGMLTQLIQYEKRWDSNMVEDFTVNNNYENLIGQPGYKALVAEENDKIIGYIYGFSYRSAVEKKPIVILDALYVAEKFRNTGCATALICEFQKFAVAEGAASIELKVFSENNPAFRLYSGFGFKEIKKYMSLDLRSESFLCLIGKT